MAINATDPSPVQKTSLRKNEPQKKRWRDRLSGPWLVAIGSTIGGGLVILFATIYVTPLLTGANPSSTSSAPASPASPPAAGLHSPGAVQCQVKINTNNGQVAVCGTINNYTGLSNDPRARISQLTGSWTEQGFVNAIIDRETSIVALYLKSGMKATTVHEGASAILFGFQGAPTQNGDPVALVKTFQAAGFKVDDELQDSYLMGALTDNMFPLMLNTDLAPKDYTGGYEGGTFVGSLLFWIVQRALYAGPTDQDIQVIRYLISQGADCKVPLSFLKYNGPTTLAGTSPYEELLPIMQSCAK